MPKAADEVPTNALFKIRGAHVVCVSRFLFLCAAKWRLLGNTDLC
jgi:hypothetical protein